MRSIVVHQLFLFVAAFWIFQNASGEILTSQPPRTNREFRQAHADILKAGGLDVYRKSGLRDAKWNESAEKLLEGFAPWEANLSGGDDFFSMLPAPQTSELLAWGK